MLSPKVKRMLVILFAMVAFPLMACDDGPPSSSTTVISTNTSSDWARCDSLTCTYKVKLSGDIKTAISGVRIKRSTATPLGGNWE